MPALGCGLVEVGRLPREAVAEGLPLDVEVVGQLALAGLPLATLDELHDTDPPPAGPSARHHAERGTRLALPVPGVEQHDRLDARHSSSLSLPGRGPNPALLRSVGPLPHAVRVAGTLLSPSPAGNPVRVRGCPATVTGRAPARPQPDTCLAGTTRPEETRGRRDDAGALSP